ncbi:MAG: Gfo/Idh/MocA family oxidoreductase [Candidatus Omnitrophica bacterium]|nr:Gfo/Idh/MocA family oxidoreductase [Candidatus Omnitrophota bacterium]
MKTYRVGLIGFGLIGKVHAYAYSVLKYYYDLPFQVELYGLCSRTAETLRKGESYGFQFMTTDFQELIVRPEVDVIDICCPNTAHLFPLRETLKRNKPVYCEKPVVTSLEEVSEVEKLLPSYTATNQVTFHNRFYPATLKTKELLENGFLGTPISFRVAYYHSGSLDPEKPIGWKQEKGAGLLLDLGSHALDLVYWFLGRVDRVIGQTRILYPCRPAITGEKVPVEVEDYALVMLCLENGARGTVEVSKVAAGSEDDLSYELYGTGGAIRYHSMEPNFLHIYDARAGDGFIALPTVQRYAESCFPGPKFSIGWVRGHIHAIYSFLKAVHLSHPASPSLVDGLYNTRIIEAVKRSEKTARWERID